MSSSEEECATATAEGTSKRRRSCDACRKKRGRCDGRNNPFMQCSNCHSQGLPCTYVAESTRRATSKRYISSLENKIERLDEVLRRLCPDDRNYDDWIDSLNEDQVHPPTPASMAFPPRSLLQPEPFESITKVIRISISHDSSQPPGRLEEDDDPMVVASSSLHTKRFFGKSSPEVLIRTALTMKKLYAGSHHSPDQPILSKRREEFWAPRPWERKADASVPRQKYDFPPTDLAITLTDLYFEHANLYHPLLHRPSFERSVREGQHYNDEGFAEVYLLVCAIGSRFSEDARVRMDGVGSQHSAGWKYFNQVECKTSFLALPSLYEVQSYCLTIYFILFSSTPQATWPLIAIAIRLVQDVGVHRWKATAPTAEDELWKRAFWFLLYLDRMVCLYLGRSLTLHDEDFDVDYPIDCDDEYWEHPDPRRRFVQPPNKPSLVTAYILQLKLIKILGACNQALYPLKKIFNHLGLASADVRAHIVPELDSSVNTWLETLPDHLRWDPNRPSDKFFHQSVMLHALCCYTRIFIHRSFFTPPNAQTSIRFPSLAICTTAARSCINVADIQLQRGVPLSPIVQVTSFTSAVLILVGIWAGKKSGSFGSSSLEEHPDMESVRTAMRIFKQTEGVWLQAGKFWDILSVLSSTREHANQESSPRDVGMSLSSYSMTGYPQVPGQDVHMGLLNDLLTSSPGGDAGLWHSSGSLPSETGLEDLAKDWLLPFELFTPSSCINDADVPVTGLEQQRHLGAGGNSTNNFGVVENELDNLLAAHGEVDWQAYVARLWQ
ncbi:unnamed protein product [Cyclocybe aegerita]|uniref:Zn(2)-C6 fungal-type domain-containing protein n=1 Tax=Cyclocybe aegerita TaxID=1973307 RepID=A0A8S0XPU7_CYCAE|nr:unnamed protein product [Cyclocybe aegerita]